MKKKILSIVILFFTLSSYAQQDTLPKFSVKKKEGVITVGWINAFKNAAQINIQRSKDSNRNFITIHSSPNPDAKTYSYTDKTAKNDSGYYRIFILFDGSNYMFTQPKRAVEEKVIVDPKTKNQPVKKQDSLATINPVTGAEINSNNQPGGVLPAAPKPPVKKAWEPSVFVFTGDDGNVVISLPDAIQKKYSLTILKEEGRPIFVIPQITETYLVLDKAGFLRSGWYYFELKEDGKVKERNKFLITRDN